jgi:transmembrane sensor
LLSQVGSGDRIETGIGEQRRVALGDGSTLHLNTASISTVRFSAEFREVRLDDGEAFFSVAPNPGRPFVVTTPEGRAEALGTAFAVHTRDSITSVSVAEGTVAFTTRAGERTLLAPGERITVGPAGSVVGTVDPARIASWTTGRLEYDDVPLASLIEDLNRYFPVRMALADPDIGARRVLASVRLTDQEGLLDTLNETLGLEWYAITDDLIIIQAAD